MSSHDPAKTTETVQLMLSIAADLRRLSDLGRSPGVPYLDMGRRLNDWADDLTVAADQAAHRLRSPELQQLVREHPPEA
ncbi:hypothetical protein [Streptomyces longwoodensis]|uniref:hypothetical protein n=1 Tax=Streptomyces longwoodensis TaxID=68231 RepID=UPI00225BC126|nr:hypothetical protein [Streptomyces longwoodensis]MCX5000957.1 hypothetical protein [Streptomyces longwoodensis]